MMTELSTHGDWYRLIELADAGDSLAQYEVAYYYEFGLIFKDVEIVEENKKTAFDWYYKAYKNGSIDAIIRVADFLSEGLYCEQNIELAIELYQKRIGDGYGLAANNLATVYRDQKDYQNAFKLYQIAQDLDHSNPLQLAFCYYFGVGTEKNMEMAFVLFNSISKGISPSGNCQYDIDEANYFLGKIYLNGEAGEQSVKKARIFLKLANTDNDHRSAQALLGVIGEND